MRYRTSELEKTLNRLIESITESGREKQTLVIPFGSYTRKKYIADLDILIFSHYENKVKYNLRKLARKEPVKVEVLKQYTKGRYNLTSKVLIQVFINNYNFAEFLKVSRGLPKMEEIKKYRITNKNH